MTLTGEARKQYAREHYKANKERYLSGHRRRRAEAMDFAAALKVPCVSCGEDNPACIDFHHTDRSAKDAAVSKMVHDMGFDRDRLAAEIAKCVCLCANCHRKLHAGKLVLMHQ